MKLWRGTVEADEPTTQALVDGKGRVMCTGPGWMLNVRLRPALESAGAASGHCLVFATRREARAAWRRVNGKKCCLRLEAE